MKIGIISDTHGILRDEFKKELKTCNYIIHAGDIGTEKCYKELKELGIPFYAVRGNCDYGTWAKYLPETLAFPIEGLIFYLIHDINKMSYTADAPDVVISGHTHKKHCSTKCGCTYINPGSAAHGRGMSGASIAIITLENQKIDCEFLTSDEL